MFVRAELVARLVEMLRSQKELLKVEAVSSAARAERQRKAEEVYRRVCEWRMEREETARREQEEWERKRRREEREREIDKLKLAQHRAKLKAKVRNFLQLLVVKQFRNLCMIMSVLLFLIGVLI